MFRLLLTVFVVIGAVFLYGNFQELNPGSVTIRLSPASTFELSPAALVLTSVTAGAIVVALLVGIRETRDLILNWRSTRLRRREQKVESLHREGTHAFLSKRTGEAIGFFQKALALDPNHSDSLLWLGNIYRTEENFTEAIRLHRKARSVDERNPEILLALARDLEDAKRFEDALQTLDEVLKLDQANLAALLRKRDLYIRVEKWESGLEIQRRIVKTNLSTNDQQAQNKLLVGLTYETGRQLLERGHPEKARPYFRGAIKRDKTFLPAYMGMGEVLIREGKIKNAAEILEKAYKKTGNIILLHRLEELHLELGEPGEILRIYHEAESRDPQNTALKFYLGKLYYRLEMVDEAFDVLCALEGPQEELADYHKIMANLYLRKQQTEQAVDELKRALGFKKRVVVPYRCRHCQVETAKWSGRCGRCGTWNTLVALPWVDASAIRDHGYEGAQENVSVPYRGLASPFETV